MTFLERYQEEETWQGKVCIMEIYHLTMSYKFKDWTISKTAHDFGVSIGLVSENLRLAEALHQNPELLEISFRQTALVKIRK